MIRLLRLVSLREHRSHWSRALLVVAGIGIGIALVLAIDLVNRSVIAGFRQTFVELAGPADLEVTLGIGELGFGEDTVEVVRQDPGVALAIPLVRGTVTLADDPSEVLQLYGAELNAEEDLNRYSVRLVSGRREAIEALTDPHAILVADTFMARLGLAVGSKVTLATPRGVNDFTIRGALSSGGIARVVGGQLVVMDIAAAQTQQSASSAEINRATEQESGSSVARLRGRLRTHGQSARSVRVPLPSLRNGR